MEVTLYIQHFEEMFGYSITAMDVLVTDTSHETLLPKFITDSFSVTVGLLWQPFFELTDAV